MPDFLFQSLIIFSRQQVKRAFTFLVWEVMVIDATYSLERMHSYINAEQEPKPTKQGIPPAYWPASGDLKVEKLSARYSLVRDLAMYVRRY